MENELTLLVGSIAGAILSLLFKYVPGLNTRWDRLQSERKQMFMGLMLILVAVVMYLLSCWKVVPDAFVVTSCDSNGLVQVGFALFAALVSNQSIDRITPNSKAVVESRLT